MTEEGREIITAIKGMNASLDDFKSQSEFIPQDEELKISYPLVACLEMLKEKHRQVSSLYKIRTEQVQSE
jgi:protein regulator of cytokinesis 1